MFCTLELSLYVHIIGYSTRFKTHIIRHKTRDKRRKTHIARHTTSISRYYEFPGQMGFRIIILDYQSTFGGFTLALLYTKQRTPTEIRPEMDLSYRNIYIFIRIYTYVYSYTYVYMHVCIIVIIRNQYGSR